MIIQFLGLVLFMLLIVAFVAYFQGGIPISDPAKLASFHIQPDLLSNLNDSTGAKVSGRTASDNGTLAHTRQILPEKNGGSVPGIGCRNTR